MSTTNYITKWGSDEVIISADWAQASCPVQGVSGGYQVADFGHEPAAAMRSELESFARADGTYSGEGDEETERLIDAAVAAMKETNKSPSRDDE